MSKSTHKRRKEKKGIALWPTLLFVFPYLVAVGISVVTCKNLDVEKFWTIFANITVVFGGMGLVYSFLQLGQGEKTLTKEMVLLEVELGNELNDIRENMQDVGNASESREQLRKALQYISKLNLLQKKQVIDINELCRMYGMNLKSLFIEVVKMSASELERQADIEQILLNYRQDVEEIFAILCGFDKDMELLKEKVELVTGIKQKNYLMKNLETGE